MATPAQDAAPVRSPSKRSGSGSDDGDGSKASVYGGGGGGGDLLTAPGNLTHTLSSASAPLGASASGGDASAGRTGAHAPPVHSHSAHHLRYGAIKVGGFVPTHADFDAADLAACGPKGIRARDLRREALDAEARRIHGARRYLLRKPRASQYFRGQTLVRGDEERSSGRLELFFDLVFVGIIAVLASEVIASPSGASLVRYLIAYFLAWAIWSVYRELNDCYWTGDAWQSALTLFVMAMLVVFGNNATEIQQDLADGPARATAAAAYLLAEGSMYATQLFYSLHIKAYRVQVRSHVGVWLLVAGLYIGAIFAPVRAAVGLAAAGLVLGYGSWAFFYSPWFKRLARLRYSSAVAIEHEAERMADFCTLVLGETIYSIVSGHPAGYGVTPGTGRAVLALVIAFAFLQFYTLRSGAKNPTHALRRNVLSAQAWFLTHMPFVSALTLFGDACGDFVKEEQVEGSIRWILCGTYSLAMLCVWILAMIERDNDQRGEVWVPKFWRLLPRLACALVAVFLPLTPFHVLEAEGAHSGEAGAGAGEGAAAAGEALGSAASGGEHHLSVRAYESSLGHSGEVVRASLNTTAMLGVLAALSLAALLWEWLASLDGPATPADEAPEHLRDGDAHTPPHALRTPAWKGMPTFVEPGFTHFDKGHQREHEGGDGEGTAEEPNAAATVA